ncbi:MAG TPA: hypothetical protein VF883_21645 [Thermoanaerobaculia bacterium]|jgi:hypothetical protein
MGKNLKEKDLARGRASRSLLAVSLAASLAAFGCTTNHNLGNGTPVRSGGELRSAPTSGVTSGQERTTPPPMTSSYTGADALPRVTPRSASRADRAAAILAGNQPIRGRYLGVVNPGPAGRPYVSDGNVQFVNPALATNPQLTLNSSISSGPVAGINTGVGSTVLTNGATVTTGAASPAATTGLAAATTVAGAATVPTATAATGATLPAGAFAASTFTPTESVIANPSVTAASVGVGRTGGAVVANSGTAAATTTPATTSGAATTAATPTVTAASGNIIATSGSVVLVRGANGAATITNTNTNTGTGRNQ